MNKLSFDYQSFISDDDDLKFKQDILKRALNNAQVRDFLSSYDFSKEEIEEGAVKIAQVLDDNDLCNGCTSLAKCVKKDKPGTCLRLTLDEYLHEIENKYVYCEYKIKWVNLLKHVKHSDIDNETTREVYNKVVNFIKSNPTLKSDFKNVLSEVTTVMTKRMFKDQFIKGYYVISNNGNGRVLLQYAFIKSLQCGYSTAFIDSPTLFIPLTDNVRSELRDYAIEEYNKAKNVEVLLIDNLGVEPKNYKIRDQYLIPLLTERTKRGLLTIVTSRVSIDELSDLYQCRDKVSKQFFSTNFKTLLSQKEIIEIDLFESN